MKTTTYPGINYAGFTGANSHLVTGIRYGVIHSNRIACFDDIATHGTDLDYEEYINQAKQNLRHALSDYFSSHASEGKDSRLDMAVESAFDAVSDEIADRYESSGDCTRYRYERDGLILNVASDGDIFVIESPFFTYAQFCSPCAPGACYLTSPLAEPVEANKCYCLPADWFNDDEPMPYPVYELKTGKLVQPV